MIAAYVCVVVHLPAEGEVLQPKVFDGPHLVAFSDASHAPLKSSGRRGISGGVISYGGALIKTLGRHQILVSLSSMEAELFALQSVAQELSSMGKIVARILGSFKEIDAGQTRCRPDTAFHWDCVQRSYQ